MTHKEINDACQQCSLLPDEDTNGLILDLMQALNDKIQNLECEVRVLKARTEFLK